MEQIIRKDGQIYYGDILCRNADDAYGYFREDYHAQLGKRVYRRLNRVGQREERVHEFGFCFAGGGYAVHNDFYGRIDTRLLGLVCGSYCRMLGGWDVPREIGESEFEQWYDVLFSEGSRGLRLVGRNTKAGRTSKMLRKRYR